MANKKKEPEKTKQPKKDFSYTKWNPTTALCYYNNLCCENCYNKQICDSYDYAYNEYKIKPIKYATIKTYQNIGKGIGKGSYKRYVQQV